MSDLILSFIRQYESEELVSYGSLLSLLDSCVSVLENESPSYRPLSSQKKPGGLLDFTLEKNRGESLPVIVVPDLHGREKFIIDILRYRFPHAVLKNQKNLSDSKSIFLRSPSEKSLDLPAFCASLEKCAGLSVLECLERGLLYVCCLGDIFHSEARGRERWISAFEEYSGGNRVNSFMKSEMKENLSLLEMLLVLKTTFASHFHILKGNHENVLNEMNVKPYGNVPFRKFCDEGNMVADFLQSYYDDLILHEISCFEKSLPVCAVFDTCIVSHAEPAKAYTRKEIINYHEKDSSVVFGLTWTANGKADEDSVEKTIRNLAGRKNAKNYVWLGGHRPVAGKYAFRQDGRYIQIHNPDEENVAVAFPERKFNPAEDIVNVESCGS